ncbi:MAG: hypothetical protein E6I91_04405 [Chloroflexi bacterium]|nr:MAG: hypothetical protein E6I91_04405 [Chloroflexota bacterium]
MTTISSSRPRILTHADDVQRKKVIIGGGGLAGLSAARPTYQALASCSGCIQAKILHVATNANTGTCYVAIVFSNKRYSQEQDKITYEEWHLQHGVSHKMLKKMFLPMALALKFLPPEELSAKVVLDVSGIFLREEIIDRVWNDMKRVFPQTAAGAKILKSSLVRIPQSVYWPKPGLDALPPTQQSPIDNLFLAGHAIWTSMLHDFQSLNRHFSFRRLASFHFPMHNSNKRENQLTYRKYLPVMYCVSSC